MASLERILLVESHPDIADVIAGQALRPLGYTVEIVTQAGMAIRQALQSLPDVIVTNLHLPDLSGKDLLVAFVSQGLQMPIIVIAEKGNEQEVIQAFRLGAADALLWPAREAEVVAAVERVLKQVRQARSRQRLNEQLKATNERLQRKVSELTTIISIGKAVVSITDRRRLLDTIIEGALRVAEADLGWLLLREERSKQFILVSQRNLPEAWAKKIGHPLEDGISALVALSGASLLIHGQALQKFKASMLGKAAAVMPIKVQEEVIGLMVVLRKADVPFEEATQTLLEAVADYASISLLNERLFLTVQKAAETARAGEQRQRDELSRLREALQKELDQILHPMGLLLTGRAGPFNDQQRQALLSINAAAQRLSALIRSDRSSRLS